MGGYPKFEIGLATSYVASKTHLYNKNPPTSQINKMHFWVPKYATTQYTISIMEQ
jgi:hypothetical protein